jgi:sulfur-oxidizing protein SoxY
MGMLSRRDTLALGLGAAAIGVVGSSTPALANDNGAAAEIAKFTGGATPTAARVTLDLPEIAENGNAVPLTVSVQSQMQGQDMVRELLILADGNPLPGVARFTFSAMSGQAEAVTRIRLAQTQNVIAVAKMADGSFLAARREVKVTIGGCGG